MYTVLKHLENNLDIENLGIYLMFITGIRIGEFVTLKPSDLDDMTVKVRRTETRYLGEDGKYVCDV